MPNPSSLHELTTLIRSYHSLVAVESSEEERVARLVQAAGQSLGISAFEWSVSQGLRFGGAALGDRLRAMVERFLPVSELMT